jgi:hypothetical protein
VFKVIGFGEDGGMDVINREALVERFGDWPSFHDAEIYAVHLDSGQRTDGVPRLQLDVYVIGPAGEHTLVTLAFTDVEAVELDGFGPQNVLDDLVMEDVTAAAGRQVQVTLPSNNGLAGSFRCRTVTVLDAVAFAPGSHSVYGR